MSSSEKCNNFGYHSTKFRLKGNDRSDRPALFRSKRCDVIDFSNRRLFRFKCCLFTKILRLTFPAIKFVTDSPLAKLGKIYPCQIVS